MEKIIILLLIYGLKFNADWDIVDNLILSFNVSTRLNNTKTKQGGPMRTEKKRVNGNHSSDELTLGYRF